MSDIDMKGIDVLVVGAGNAAACAPLSAVAHGAKVLILETAPKESRGGNSAFTGGAFRFAYNGVDDLMQVWPRPMEEGLDNIDFGTYTHEQYYDDVFRMTQYRSDPDLTEVLITNSFDTAKWMTTHGIELIPSLGRQAFKVDGKFKFWGGLALHINGGGAELLPPVYAAAGKKTEDKRA